MDKDKAKTPSGVVLINKRLITALNLSFNHKLDPATPGQGGGWRLTADEDGQMQIRLTDGNTETVEVKRSDQFLSIGDDLYVARHRRKDGARPGQPIPQTSNR